MGITPRWRRKWQWFWKRPKPPDVDKIIKEFQEKTKEHIFFKKRKKTIISSARGTKTKYLEKAEEIIPKPKQAYITINRGTKRVLIDIN